MSHTFHRITGLVHKWVGIILGIQIMLWVSGGFIMSWYPIEKVRGEHLRAEQHEPCLTLGSSHDLDVLGRYLATLNEPIKKWEADYLNGDAVFRITHEGGDVTILDGFSGLSIKPFTETYIKAAATMGYAGQGEITAVERLDETSIEYRGPTPVWKVDFDDKDNTSFYISDKTGKLVSVRTDLWRFYDFMWMLHIMDYDERSDFNSPLLYLTSFAAILFTLTGFILFFMRRKPAKKSRKAPKNDD